MSTDALEKIKSKRSVLRKLTTLVNKVEVKLNSGEENDESELHEDYEIILDRAKNGKRNNSERGVSGKMFKDM
ncbi:uncharacterized protein TNCT_230151 [Trichonephila clavata]|uniref:Uncharacterized protein n=1 Tax=Trichonephila clavata TaxID=2740835 RepID=A0A8X6LYG2_TRICU|nr:uncharacterized protein TNCT_230151 [Trichonephila clavata]